ncbi:CbtB domain-containing protein [Haloglomus salinum]|jgi:cobalt transporter subunit CbtB|uniref:CbtB domain-containing protein n=1 Tax=Haloglomus salinum TaxID=2962673 RepID=UPI0020C96E5A|nr:CbtB domain-containing protein [Haloglomus salinum]
MSQSSQPVSRASTVQDRFTAARTSLTATQVAVGTALVAGLLFLLVFAGEPAVHESLHDARHAAGIVCH